MATFYRKHIDVSALPPAVQVKWDRRVLAEGFVPVPKRLLRSLTTLLGPTPEVVELAAILAIVDFRRPNGPELASAEYLAFIAGLEVDQFRSALDKLEKRGWAKVVTADEGRLNVSLGPFNAAIREATEN